MNELDSLYDLELEDDDDTTEVTIGIELPEDCFMKLQTPQGNFLLFTGTQYQNQWDSLGAFFNELMSNDQTLEHLSLAGFELEREDV